MMTHHHPHHLFDEVWMSDEPKILLQRYRVEDHVWLNKYASFCSAIQYPGFVNVTHPQRSPDFRSTAEIKHLAPSIYDYFGYRMHNFGVVTTDQMAPCFQWLRTFEEDDLRLFQEIKPPFFFINTRILHYPDNGNDNVLHYDNLRWKDHWVPVIYKDSHYYICPCEEYAPIYRVLSPEKLFFSDEDGRQIIQFIIAKALGSYCHCNNFALLLPKRSAQFDVNVVNWDQATTYEMQYCIPYPLTMTAKVPEPNHTSVQIIKMNDDTLIKSIDFVDDDIDDSIGDVGDGDDNE
jgi:hypothetical protein